MVVTDDEGESTRFLFQVMIMRLNDVLFDAEPLHEHLLTDCYPRRTDCMDQRLPPQLL
jgi:hypothetical protein